jgi:lipocalin
MNLVFVCFILKIFFSSLSFETQNLKKCRSLKLNFDLNIKKFVGTWYPVAKSKNFHHSPECLKINLQYVSEKKLMVGISDLRLNSTQENISTIESSDNKNSYHLKSKFYNGLLSVIDTDYVTYSVVIGCTEKAIFGRHYYAFILARNTLSQSKIQDLQKYIEKEMKIKKFVPVKHGKAC